MSRRPAFDPSRLDDELDQLLPPPTAASPDLDALPHRAADLSRQRPDMTDYDTVTKAGPKSGAEERVGTTEQRPGRGSGGRPRRGEVDTDQPPAVAAVRIPKPLYDAVVQDLLAGMVERPSYAQIVAWTCEDHPDEVLAEIEHAALTAARTPRGRKLATEGVPLALRLRADERLALDDLIARASAQGRPTRTAAVTAVLRVAVKQGISAPS